MLSDQDRAKAVLPLLQRIAETGQQILQRIAETGQQIQTRSSPQTPWSDCELEDFVYHCGDESREFRLKPKAHVRPYTRDEAEKRFGNRLVCVRYNVGGETRVELMRFDRFQFVSDKSLIPHDRLWSLDHAAEHFRILDLNKPVGDPGSPCGVEEEEPE